jgi:hypothetical protein
MGGADLLGLKRPPFLTDDVYTDFPYAMKLGDQQAVWDTEEGRRSRGSHGHAGTH